VSQLQPGTTMYRIGEVERVTREMRQDVRELFGRLELAEGRIRELADDLRDALNRIHALEDRLPDFGDPGPGPDPEDGDGLDVSEYRGWLP
jgi:hypothetical protein